MRTEHTEPAGTRLFLTLDLSLEASRAGTTVADSFRRAVGRAHDEALAWSVGKVGRGA